MKHLRLIFICSLLLAAMQMQGQTPTFKWGAEEAFTCKTQPVIHNGYCYAVSYYYPFIDKIDPATGNVVKRGAYEPDAEKNSRPKSSNQIFLSTAGGLLLAQDFTQRWYATQIGTYTITEVDTTSLSVGRTILTTEGYGNNVEISPDKRFLCVYGAKKDVSTQEVVSYKITVIDAVTKSVLWEKEVGQKITYAVLAINNNGSVIGAASFKGRKGDTPVYITANDFMEIALEKNDQLLNDGAIYFLANGKTILFGTYRNKDDEYGWSRGYYHAEVGDNYRELKYCKYTPYSEQVINIEKGKQSDKINNVWVEDIKLLDNGEMVVVMSKAFAFNTSGKEYMGAASYVSGHDVYAGSGITSTIVPEYKLIYNFRKDGSLKYEKVIKLATDEQTHDLYVFTLKDNKLGIMQLNKGGKLSCILVQENGDYQVLYPTDKLADKIFTTSIQELDRNRFLVFTFKSIKKSQFGVMEFK